MKAVDPAKTRAVYKNPAAMEPVFPHRSSELDERAVELIRRSAA